MSLIFEEIIPVSSHFYTIWPFMFLRISPISLSLQVFIIFLYLPPNNLHTFGFLFVVSSLSICIIDWFQRLLVSSVILISLFPFYILCFPHHLYFYAYQISMKGLFWFISPLKLFSCWFLAYSLFPSPFFYYTYFFFSHVHVNYGLNVLVSQSVEYVQRRIKMH